MSTVVVGLDVGGTWIRAGLVDRHGHVSLDCRVRTDPGVAPDQVVPTIAALVQGVSGRSATRPGGIGVAIAGVLDEARNGVCRAVNLPTLEGLSLRGGLERIVGLPVRLVTDSEAATWGEYAVRRPAADRFAHLRIGTGIALGVVVDGELLRLDAGRTEHLDVLVVDRTDAAVACSCGLRGCLEAIASGRALERSVVAVGLETVGSLQTACDAGMAEAARLVDDAAGAVVAALDNIVERFGPSVACIGGGVATHLPSLVRSVTELWRRDTAQHPARAVATIVPAVLGDMSGVIGAGLLALEAE